MDNGNSSTSTGSQQIADSAVVETRRGRLLLVDGSGSPITAGADANDLIGTAWSHDAAWVAVPVERLDPAFFRLRTGLAGEVAQKFATYRIGLAIVGDITQFTAESAALRDFVRETNAGQQLWFFADRAELEDRLAAEA